MGLVVLRGPTIVVISPMEGYEGPSCLLAIPPVPFADLSRLPVLHQRLPIPSCRRNDRATCSGFPNYRQTNLPSSPIGKRMYQHRACQDQHLICADTLRKEGAVDTVGLRRGVVHLVCLDRHTSADREAHVRETSQTRRLCRETCSANAVSFRYWIHFEMPCIRRGGTREEVLVCSSKARAQERSR